MKWNLFKRDEITEVEKRVQERSGLRLKKVQKGIAGDFSASREFAIQGDRQPSNGEPIKLGDARIMPNRIEAQPYRVQSLDTATGNPRPETFTHGDTKAGYLGGAERAYRPGFVESESGTPGTYAFRESDADRRGPANPFDGPEGGSGIEDASDQNWPDAGLVGARSPSSFTSKALKRMLADEDDESKRKALKSALRALKAAAKEDEDEDEDEDDASEKHLRKSSNAGTLPGGLMTGRSSVAKRRGLFTSAIFKRQAISSNPGENAADRFLSED